MSADATITSIDGNDQAAVRDSVDLLAEAMPPACAGLVPYHAARYPAFMAAILAPPPTLRTATVRVIRLGAQLIAVADWRVTGTDLFLNGIAVRADHRGRGLGSRLLADGLRIASALALSKLRLDVAAGNAGARSLYRRMGFQETGYSTWQDVPIAGLAAPAARFRLLDWATFTAHRAAYGFGDVAIRDEGGTVGRVRVVGDSVRVEPGELGAHAGSALRDLVRASRVYTVKPTGAPDEAGGFASFARMSLPLSRPPVELQRTDPDARRGRPLSTPTSSPEGRPE